MTENERSTDTEGMHPKIREAFFELEAVLERHDLAGVLMIVTKDDVAGWITHFPHWTLLDVDGTRVEDSTEFALRKPGESCREAAERTLQAVDSIAAMADECLVDCSGLAHDLEATFENEGLIELEDIDEEASIDPNAKPN